MYDIDDLIELRKRGKAPRDPFAQSFEQINKDFQRGAHVEDYQRLGQNSGYRSPKQSREYYEKQKGIKAHIEYMSPQDYFKEIGQDMDTFIENESHGKDYINNLTDSARKGSKFAMPSIEYENGKYNTIQEGRHRAIMAKDLGVEKMPVVIVDKKREYRDSDFDDYISPEERNKKRNRNAFTFDDEELEVEF